MSECQETKKVKTTEKGSGRTITKYVRICGLAAVEGSDRCPRHKAIRDAKAQSESDKVLSDHLKRNVSFKGQGLPKTRAELLQRGYLYVGNKLCDSPGCRAPIEMWRTPNQKIAPFNPMPEMESHAQSHYATCNRAADFRRPS